ncbi:MAG: hypothetical protein SGJ27_30790 [Candidatus Melainabacteria bacterium]|nr:hypothetical protein [Candidatus Melainabacteria bacterium]
MRKHITNMGKRKMRSLPKIMLHEHLDCSLRPRTMLELWESLGFEKAKIAFPADVLETWRRAGSESGTDRRRSRAQAAASYQKFLVGFASQSLANYVGAIVDHVLPLMQTPANLTRITEERIDDAIADGIVGMELRFAPQLHTWGGLSLEQVMDAVVAGTRTSPFPIKLTLCALRHENGDMARKIADLCVKYQRHVGVFDLAADEKANPGLLKWWLKAALYVKMLAPKTHVTIHLWETDEPTDLDIALLRGFEGLLNEATARAAKLGDSADADAIWSVAEQVVEELYPGMSHIHTDADSGSLRIGHGFRGNRQGNRLLEVCPTSNVVTGQVASFADHPVDRLHREGKRVTVNTDGTLFTEVQLSDEYRKLQEHFGWTAADFLKVNLTALEGSSFSQREKARLRAVLKRAYGRP